MNNLDWHLDNILKASGSGLKNYTMQKTIDDMRKALSAAISEEREACALVCDDQAGGAYWEGADACASRIRARGEA